MCVRVCVCVCAGAREGVLCRGCCGGGGGGSQFLHINITPNRNRKSCYSLRTFMRSVRQQLAILQMGIGYNEFITMFFIQVTFKLKTLKMYSEKFF